MKKAKRISWPRLLVGLAILVFFSAAGWLMYLTADYYYCLDAYSGSVARKDQMAAREDLEKLQYFYNLNKKLESYHLDWLADKYFFKEAVYHEAAYDYLVNRHERVIEKMQNDNSFWARFLRANSAWRLAQGIFEQSFQRDPATKAAMRAKAEEMALATKDDYEEAVKISRGDHLPSSWNYDLTTDDAARQAALAPKPAKIIIKLGTGGKKDKGLGKDKGQGPKGDGSKDLEIEGPPTDGQPKAGSKRPG